MRKLMITAAVLAMVAASPAIARGGHGHGHHMHRHSQRALSTPASAPSSSSQQSKKADASSPEQLDPEDAALDQKIKSICRGC